MNFCPLLDYYFNETLTFNICSRSFLSNTVNLDYPQLVWPAHSKDLWLQV